MAYEVTSWFWAQMQDQASEPKRVFTIGDSEYSDRVESWPHIKRTTEELKAVSVQVPLSNVDGNLNTFFTNLYTLPNTCTLKMGWTHATSGDELLTLYTGFIKKVQYQKEKCVIHLKDRLWDFSERKVGDSDAPVTFSSRNPSAIAWTVCTCYGMLSNVASTSNPDIDYESFINWTASFSASLTSCQARYEGMKTMEAIDRLVDMTMSAAWIDGAGKLNFKRLEGMSSLDTVITNDELLQSLINVDGLSIINRQFVYYDYSAASDYWAKSLFYQNSTSINSFGLHISLLKDETIWFVDTVSAIGMAQRRVFFHNDPPKEYDIQTGLVGLNREMGETIRLVDSFYGVTSADGWLIKEMGVNMDTGELDYLLSDATVMNGFILDSSDLDGIDLLL